MKRSQFIPTIGVAVAAGCAGGAAPLQQILTPQSRGILTPQSSVPKYPKPFFLGNLYLDPHVMKDEGRVEFPIYTTPHVQRGTPPGKPDPSWPNTGSAALYVMHNHVGPVGVAWDWNNDSLAGKNTAFLLEVKFGDTAPWAPGQEWEVFKGWLWKCADGVAQPYPGGTLYAPNGNAWGTMTRNSDAIHATALYQGRREVFVFNPGAGGDEQPDVTGDCEDAAFEMGSAVILAGMSFGASSVGVGLLGFAGAYLLAGHAEKVWQQARCSR